MKSMPTTMIAKTMTPGDISIFSVPKKRVKKSGQRNGRKVREVESDGIPKRKRERERGDRSRERGWGER